MAMGVTVGMVSFVMLSLVVFCRWWIPRHHGGIAESFEPFTIALQEIESKTGDRMVDSGLKAIPVTVSDVNGFMLLDTGSNRTMLSLDFCKEHALSGRWVKPNTTNLDGTHVLYVEANLAMGNLRVKSFPFWAFELNHLRKSLAAPPLIGILGTDILNRFNYSINFPDNLLQICIAQESDNTTHVRIPIAIRNNKIFVPIDIQENGIEFLLDTGSNHARLAEKHLALCPGEVRDVKQTWSDINGWHTRNVKQIDLSNIHMGPIPFVKLTFSVRGDESLISASMLRNMTATIYPAKKYMTLVPHGRTEESPD